MKLSVVILAGGVGSRMKSSLPKSLHFVKNIPMITRIINTTLSLNPHEIVILCSPLTYEKTKKVVEGDFRLSEIYTKIRFAMQPTPRGTGHAAKYAIINIYSTNNVLILNGDSPFVSINTLRKMIKTNEPKLVIAKKTNPYGNGRIVIGNDNEILEIVEEKDCNELQRQINIVNGGMYFINRYILKTLLSYINNKNKQNEYYITDIVQLYKNLYGRTFKGVECDEFELQNVNTKEQLELCDMFCEL